MSTYCYKTHNYLPADKTISEHAHAKKYLEIDLVQIIDRDTPEGEEAWDNLTDHHCVPFAKDGMFILDRFWNDNGEEPCQLHKIVMDYISAINANLDDYDDILLNVTWQQVMQ